MKINFLFGITAALLMLAGVFSCTNKMNDEDNKEVTVPENAILGKWELVQLAGHPDGPFLHKPTGYVEYLPDGRFGWYDYATEEYTMFETGYWLEDLEYIDEATQKNIKELYVHYETSSVEMDDGRGGVDIYQSPPYYPDRPDGSKCKMEFINYNTMKIYGGFYYYAFIPEFIYKRKK